MEDATLIAGLAGKHRDLLNELAQADERIRQIRQEIRAMETVLRVLGFGGALPSTPLGRQTFPIFGRGEISREVLVVMREMPELRKNREIAQEIIRRKDWDTNNGLLWGRVTAAVKNYRKKLAAKASGSNSPSTPATPDA